MYLKQKTSIFENAQRLLHIAPEYCFIDRFESVKQLDYITADLESPLAKVKMDIHEMPFDKNTFDCVLCNHVMEHVNNDRKAIKEILRELKPGGWAIIQVPFFPPIPDQTLEDPAIITRKQRFLAYGQEDHVRLYGKDYKQRLKSCGFNVFEDNFSTSVPQSTFEKYALSDEIIFFCSKPVN
jgi:SAM-dependent methyltransferase